MTALHQAFEKYEHLNEEEFILEMLAGLNAAKLPRAEQVSFTLLAISASRTVRHRRTVPKIFSLVVCRRWS